MERFWVPVLDPFLFVGCKTHTLGGNLRRNPVICSLLSRAYLVCMCAFVSFFKHAYMDRFQMCMLIPKSIFVSDCVPCTVSMYYMCVFRDLV